MRKTIVMLKEKGLTDIKPATPYIFLYISILAKYLLPGPAHRTVCESRKSKVSFKCQLKVGMFILSDYKYNVSCGSFF